MRFSISDVLFDMKEDARMEQGDSCLLPATDQSNHSTFCPGVSDTSSPDFLRYNDDDDHEEEKPAVVPLTLKREELKDPDYEIPTRLDTYDSLFYS